MDQSLHHTKGQGLFFQRLTAPDLSTHLQKGRIETSSWHCSNDANLVFAATGVFRSAMTLVEDDIRATSLRYPGGRDFYICLPSSALVSPSFISEATDKHQFFLYTPQKPNKLNPQ